MKVLLLVSGVGQLPVVTQSGGDEDIEGVSVVTSVPDLLIRLVKYHPCRKTQPSVDLKSPQTDHIQSVNLILINE